MTVPAGWIFTRARMDVTTPFTSTGSAITALSLCIGSSAAGAQCAYMPNFQVVATPTPTYQESVAGVGLFASASTGDVFIQASATGGNLNVLTAGAATVTVCGYKP